MEPSVQHTRDLIASRQPRSAHKINLAKYPAAHQVGHLDGNVYPGQGGCDLLFVNIFIKTQPKQLPKSLPPFGTSAIRIYLDGNTQPLPRTTAYAHELVAGGGKSCAPVVGIQRVDPAWTRCGPSIRSVPDLRSRAHSGPTASGAVSRRRHAHGRPSNQLSNDRRRRRQTPVDASGRYVAAQEQDAKARTVDIIP